MTHCVTRQVLPAPPHGTQSTLATHANLLAGQHEKTGLVCDKVQDRCAKLA